MTDAKPPENRADEQDDQRHGATREETSTELNMPYPPNVRSGQELQRRRPAREETSAELSTPFPLNILSFAGVLALFVLILALVLDWYIDPQSPAQRTNLVQALGLITVGVAGAIGIFFTWRGQRLAREAQEANQKNALNELDLTRRGQITQRFTQAVEQLGCESLEIRLGGIYSLERTAREDRDYHWPIMEVLTTYVRQHAPGDPDQGWDEEQHYAPEPEI